MGRVYYGWRVVALSILVYALIIGTTFSAFGLFVLPVSAEFQLSRANMNSALILLNVGNAILAPFVGRMLDRVPARRIMTASAILFGLSLATLGLSRSVALSAAVVAIPLAAAMLGAGTLTMTVLLARWFVAQRGRAMALAATGMSLGAVVVTPIVGLLIDSQGWRAALLITGAVASALMLLVVALLRERPGPDDVEGGRDPAAASQSAAAGQSAAGPASAAGPMGVGVILRIPAFWLIALGASMALAVAQAIVITIVPLALELGLSTLQATSLISVTGGAAITGKLTLALVADKVDRVLLLSALIALGMLPNAALLVSDSYPMLLGCAAVVGLTSGAVPPIFYALLADRFGTASFGTVRGMMTPFVAVFGAIAVRLVGEVYDRTGGYDLAFAIFLATNFVGAVLLFSTRFTRPAGAGERRDG